MDTIFANCSETSDPHIILLSLTDKIHLKRSDKYVALSNLSLYYARKDIKSHKKYEIRSFSSDME